MRQRALGLLKKVEAIIEKKIDGLSGGLVGELVTLIRDDLDDEVSGQEVPSFAGMLKSDTSDDLMNAVRAVDSIIANNLTGGAPGLLVNGKLIPGTGDRFASVSPITDEKIWRGREASKGQVKYALKGARDAFDDRDRWAGLEWKERAEYLEKLKNVFEKRKMELAVALSIDTGRAFSETANVGSLLKSKVDAAVNHEYSKPKFVSSDASGYQEIEYVPMGVVAVIGPFNLPLHLVNGPVVHALAAGNTVVIKFSEETPLVAQLYAECLAEAGFPDGVVSVLQGGGSVGDAMVDPDYLNGIFFTGSTGVGEVISKKLADAPHVVKALEMSGINPGIVDLNSIDESDYPKVVDQVAKSAFMTMGQRCVCCRHLYLVGDVASRKNFLRLLREKVHTMGTGDIWDKNTFNGTMISAMAAQRVMEQYDRLVFEQEAGVVVPLGADMDKKANLSPAVLDMPLSYFDDTAEIFGPVLQVYQLESNEEALKLAGRTSKGLMMGVWSNDDNLISSCVKSGVSGMVNVNFQMVGASGQLPFGGVGRSGSHNPVGSSTMDSCVYQTAVIRKR